MQSEDIVFRKALKYLFRLIALRSRSRHELLSKFNDRKFPVKVSERVVDYAVKEGFVDDSKFAQEWLRFRLNSQMGLKKIALELKTKGIEEAVIRECLSKADDLEQQVLFNLAQKKAALIRKRTKDPLKAKEKLFRFLLNRGFPRRLIFAYLNQNQN